MNNKFSRMIIIYICVLCCLTGVFFLYRSSKHNMMSSASNSASTEPVVSNEKETGDSENDPSNKQNQDESEVYIPRFFVRGYFEIKEFLEEKMKEGMINDYSYVGGDYFAYVKVTEDQKQQWVKYSQEEIDKLLAKEYDGFTINVGEDNTSLNMDIKSNSDYYLATHTMQDVLFNIQNYLVFSGVKDWSCHVVIRNVDSGKDVMNMHYPNEDGNIDNSDWTNIDDPVLAYETIKRNSYSYIHYEEPVIEDGAYHSKTAGVSMIIPDGAKVSTQNEMDEINGLDTQDEHFDRLFEIKKIITYKVYEDFSMVLDSGIRVGVGISYPTKDNEEDFLSWTEKNLEEALKDENNVEEYDIRRVNLLGRECILHSRTDTNGRRQEYVYFKDGLQISILAEYETPEQEKTVQEFIENSIRSEE